MKELQLCYTNMEEDNRWPLQTFYVVPYYGSSMTRIAFAYERQSKQ